MPPGVIMKYCRNKKSLVKEALQRTSGAWNTDNMSDHEKKMRDAQMRAAINQKLMESGEKEKLKELLRMRLIECGWRDQLKAYCKEVVKKKGLEHITVDDLVAEITPRGRALIPDQVKKELLQRIRSFLAAQPNM